MIGYPANYGIENLLKKRIYTFFLLLQGLQGSNKTVYTIKPHDINDKTLPESLKRTIFDNCIRWKLNSLTAYFSQVIVRNINLFVWYCINIQAISKNELFSWFLSKAYKVKLLAILKQSYYTLSIYNKAFWSAVCRPKFQTILPITNSI